MVPAALVAGLATGALIVVLRRVAPRWPGLIVAVAAASLVVALFGLPVETIQSRYGDLPSSLPVPRLPEITYERVSEVFPAALVIAFLAGVESLLSALVADRMIGGRHRPNAEVMAQGVATSAPRSSRACLRPGPSPAPPPTSAPAGARRWRASSTR